MTILSRYKIPLLLFLSALAVFANTLDSQFLLSWDDNRYLAENTLIQHFQIGKIFSEAYWGSYIPVTLTTFAIEHFFWGLNPAGYHVVNVLIHALNGVLVFFFLLLLTGKRPAAVIGAILFIVHPVQVESVAWVTQRKNLLSMFFFMWAFISHIISRRDNSADWQYAAWGFYLLSILSKPAVVCAPLLFIAYDYFWARLPIRKIMVSNLVTWGIALAGAVAIISTSADVGGIKELWGGSRWTALQLTFLTTWENLVGLINPWEHYPHYFYFLDAIENNWRVWAGLMVILGFTGAAICSLRRFFKDKEHKPLTFFFYMWVVGFMLPVSNIIPIAIQRSDRHIYFPSVLIFLMVGMLWNRLWQSYSVENKRYVLVGSIVAITFFFTSTTLELNQKWETGGTLWRYHLDRFPDDDVAINNLAIFYYRNGQYPQALKTYTDLVKIDPGSFRPHLFIGLIAFDDKRYDDAIVNLSRAFPLAEENIKESIHAKLMESYFKAVELAKREERLEDAVNYYYDMIAVSPDFPEIYNDLGNTYRDMEDFASARNAYEKAMEISKDYYAEAHANIGQLLLAEGKTDEALALFDENLGRDPSAIAAGGRCTVFVQRKETDKAVYACFEAVSIEPEKSEYLDQLVKMLSEFYDMDRAVAITKKKLSGSSDLRSLVLGQIYANAGKYQSAIDHFQQSRIESAQYRLGDAALALENYPLAETTFNKILLKNETDVKGIGGKCLALTGKGDNEAAQPFCKEAFEEMPGEIRYAVYYADLLLEEEKYEEAIAIYENIPEEKNKEVLPKLESAYYKFGLWTDVNGVSAKAIKLCRKAIALNPDQADYHNALGQVYWGQKRLDKAIASFDKAIQLSPNFALAYTNKGVVAYMKNNIAVAGASFKRAFDLNPDLPQTVFAYCSFLAKQGRDAEEVCRKAAVLQAQIEGR